MFLRVTAVLSKRIISQSEDKQTVEEFTKLLKYFVLNLKELQVGNLWWMLHSSPFGVHTRLSVGGKELVSARGR